MTASEKTVSVTEFKAKCLGLIDGVNSKRLHRVTIVKRGRVVAALVRAEPKTAKKAKPFAHGFLKGSVVIPEGLDLTKPVFEGEIDAESGILHR
jgi:antitoxin (DNA-binding transcriptional repressor) of toxin-antitoxin stability system